MTLSPAARDLLTWLNDQGAATVLALAARSSLRGLVDPAPKSGSADPQALLKRFLRGGQLRVWARKPEVSGDLGPAYEMVTALVPAALFGHDEEDMESLLDIRRLQAGVGPTELVESPLWSKSNEATHGPPDWFLRHWQSMKGELLASHRNWLYLTAWYDRLLTGAAIPEAEVTVFATLDTLDAGILPSENLKVLSLYFV